MNEHKVHDDQANTRTLYAPVRRKCTKFAQRDVPVGGWLWLNRKPAPQEHAMGRAMYHIESMLVGTGVDLVDIGRIEESIKRFGDRFLHRVYTQGEIDYCLRKRQSAESFAARFAAKEAGAKALGTGIQHGITWKELEVVRPRGERPTLQLHGRAAEWARRLEVRRIWLAITHGAGISIATVHMERD